MKRVSTLALTLCAIFALAGPAAAQLNTGTIVGIVNDSSGLVVAGAEVRAASERTGDVRTTTTNEVGRFALPALPAGAYTIRVSARGFQTAEQTGVMLTSNEYLSLGTIVLQVGSTTETITVSASTAVVQTASAEVSALIENKQLNMLMTRGRDVISLLRVLPGVAQNGTRSRWAAKSAPRVRTSPACATTTTPSPSTARCRAIPTTSTFTSAPSPSTPSRK